MGCMLSMHKKPPAEVTREQWNEEMHKKLYEFRADKLGEDVVRAEFEEEKHRGRYHTTQKDLAPIMPLLPKTETPSLRYSAYRKSKLLENWVDDVTRVDSQIKIGEVNCNLQHSEAETDGKTNISGIAHVHCDNDNNNVYSSTHISSDDKKKMLSQDQLASVNVNRDNNSGDNICEQNKVKNLEDEEDSDCTSVNSNKCNSNNLSASPIDSNNNGKSDNAEEKEERVTNVLNECKCTTDNTSCTKTKKLNSVNGSRENTNYNKISSLVNNNDNNNEKFTSISINTKAIKNTSNNQDNIKTSNEHDMQSLPEVLITHDTPANDGTKASRATTTAASLVIKEVCSQPNSIPLVASECEEHKEEHLQTNKLIYEKESNEIDKKTLHVSTLYKVESEMNINNLNSNSVTNLNSCSCSSNMLNELCHEECHKCKKVVMSEVAITNTTTRSTHTHKHDKHAFNNTLASPTSVHYDGNNQKTFVKEKHPRIVTDPPIVFLEPRWCKYSVDIKDPKNCYTIEHKPKRNQTTANTTSETEHDVIVQNKCDVHPNGKQNIGRNGKVNNDAIKDNKDRSISNSLNNNSNSIISQNQISKVEPLHSWYSESPSTDSICATIRNTKPELLKSILKRT